MLGIFKPPPKVEAPMSINDVESGISLKLSQRSRISLRDSVEIAVIDDQPFEPATNLKNNHYRVQHFHDIDNISVLDSYPIILSDLQGVGVHLHPDLQGAHLIRELKAQSPEKVVIAYSGIGRNAVMSRTPSLTLTDLYVRMPTLTNGLKLSIRQSHRCQILFDSGSSFERECSMLG